MGIFVIGDEHHDHERIIQFDNRPDKSVEEMNKRIVDTTNEYVSEKDWLVCGGDLILNKKIRHEDNVAYVERVKYFLGQLRTKNLIFCCGNHDHTWGRGFFNRPNWLFWDLFRIWECSICNTVFDEQKRFNLPHKCMCAKDYKSDNRDLRPIYNIHPMGFELRLSQQICAEHNIPRQFVNMLVVFTHYALRVWNKSHITNFNSNNTNEIGASINLFNHSHGHLPSIKNSFDTGFSIWNRPLSLTEILTTLMPENNLKFKAE